MVLDVGPDDVGYIAMPLFHSNSLMVGLAPALVAGASVGPRPALQRLALPGRRAQVRGHVVQLHRQAPRLPARHPRERPDDADNPLRLAYGNEGSPQVVEAVAKRFGVEVVDVFGSTEGGDRPRPLGRRAAGLGRAAPRGVKIVDPDGNERPRRRVRRRRPPRSTPTSASARWSTSGAWAPSRGTTATKRPWPAPPATVGTGAATSGTSTTRVGCTSRVAPSDWLRVDGENFPAAPIEAIVARHPDVDARRSVYGVPDVDAGDQVMAALVLREGAELRPRRLRVAGSTPSSRPEPEVAPPLRADVPRHFRTTPTNKVLVRTLVHQKFRADRVGGDAVLRAWPGRGAATGLRDADEESVLHDAFVESGAPGLGPVATGAGGARDGT